MLPSVSRAFSDDIAIDLGTANTLVCVIGRGIIINEPSVVAIGNAQGKRQIFGVGEHAKRMIGRTPEPMESLRPLRDGVIADFLATEEMLRQFIRRAKSMLGFRRPRILVSVPAGATPVERRAVYDTALSAGARKVYLIAEPVAASLGAGLPIDEALGVMVLDIGGGTSDVAVLSNRKVVQARSLRCAGDAMNEAIIREIRQRHHLVVGEGNAERIKIEAGTASTTTGRNDAEIHIRGRELRRGRFKSVVLSPADIAHALDGTIDEIGEFVGRALEDLPADIVTDIGKRGICLTGGGALLDKLDEELERRVGVKFVRSEEPMNSVVRGAARVLKDISRWSHLLLEINS